MIDVVKHRWVYFIISAAIVIPGVISILLPGGLRPGIDFTSGSIMTVRFAEPVDQAQLRQVYADLGHSEAIVQRSGGENTFIIRTKPLEQPRTDPEQESGTSERARVTEQLRSRFGEVEVLAFDQVSPLIATEIVWKSVAAVAAACVFILLYLAWAFRHVPQPWRYGGAAVIALVHDALVVLGAFSILGRLTAIELDAMFITAVMTVIGFSVHDTIVVFDRIRENFVRHAGEPFGQIVNHSLTQTLGRSLNTSLTVLLVLVALLLFGGVTIRPFVLALLIGITSGTYSSIFFASMLLVIWERGEFGRLIGRRTASAAA
jgi:preprotein translocase subunit SecF